MRAVVQRVSRARVTVGGETAGEIGPGLLNAMLRQLGLTKTDLED